MNEENDAGSSPALLAAERLAEVDALSRNLRQVLAEMIADLRSGGSTTVADTLKKLNEVQAAHLKVLAAEDVFHARIGTDPDAEAIDHDAVRDQIGRQLDRLRESLLAEGFPCDLGTRSTCNAALPLRFLGDATSDATEG